MPIHLPPVDHQHATVPAGSLSAELLAGLLADGDDELAAWTLEHAMEEASRASVFDGILREAMRIVGERWRTGQWTVAEEHLASRTLLRALERVRPQPGPEGRIGPMALLAGVAGEQHMIGLVCLEQVLTEDGWTVANLGADMPAEDLGAFVLRNDVALVALSGTHPDRVGGLAESVAAVKDAGGKRTVPVMIGGQIAGIPGLAATVHADGVAHSVEEARAFAAAHRPRD